jgi:hypothetical protein
MILILSCRRLRARPDEPPGRGDRTGPAGVPADPARRTGGYPATSTRAGVGDTGDSSGQWPGGERSEERPT